MKNTEVKKEELKVQVMLGIYQVDIQTQTTFLSVSSALLVGIWAIYFSNTSLVTLLPFTVTISLFCLVIMMISGDRYRQRRKQLDNLRKQYCPEAYVMKND